jgi:hypothetical protein
MQALHPFRRLAHVASAPALALLSALAPVRAADPGTDWQQAQPPTKPPRFAAMASAFDPVSNKLLLFGGYDAQKYLADTWAFDGVTWAKLVTPVAPSARAAASMAFDSVTQTVVLFGGYNGAYLGDTWIWNGASGTWSPASPATSPKAVTGPMLFTDPMNGHAIVYGGYDGMFYQLTTYRWTGSNWQQLQPATPPWARAAAAVALDPVHHNVVLFGGLASVNPWNTWTWDGAQWQQQSPSQQPPNRYDSSAAFEPHLQNVVVFGGGSGGSTINDSWAWDGNDWHELHPAHAPPKRESFAMAYVPALDRVVVAGGEDGNLLLNDTWSFADLGEFLNIGPGLGGALGPAVLSGSGDLMPGSAAGFTLNLGNAPPLAPVSLLVGLTQGALPLKGGTLYPVPVLLIVPLQADGAGSVSLPASIPSGVPAGTTLVLQGWMPDATAPQHFGASNGLKAVVP